jgi:hypothetical protein
MEVHIHYLDVQTLFEVPPAGIEPAAFRFEAGSSVH